MIFDHFNLHANPFDENIPLEGIQRDGRFIQAISSLELLPQVGNIATLTGRTGTGKTSLLRLLTASWDASHDLCYLHLANLKGAGIFRTILNALGERPRLGKDRMFDQLYARLAKSRRPLCLMFDEVQLLDIPSMTDLRILAGHIELSRKFYLLLAGQPGFSRTLQAESLADLRERIVLRAHLGAMSLPETRAYLEHRLRLAGANTKAVFNEPAVTLMHHASEGIPRKVNRVALFAMMNAYQTGKDTVDEAVMRNACTAEQS
jgi:general secretion pathway protein A